MKTINRVIHSMYMRILLIFTGVFMLTLLLTGIVVNITQYNLVQRNAIYDVENQVAQILMLTSYDDISIDEALKIVKSRDTEKTVYSSIDSISTHFTATEVSAIEENHVIIKNENGLYQGVTATFKVNDQYVHVAPVAKAGPMGYFVSTQTYIYGFSLLFGVMLMMLAAYAIMKPIKRLSNAALDVSKGDFGVNVPVSGNSEISILTKNFNAMVKELSKNEYLHKEFMSNVSHEFKTPITSLKGYAKLLKDESIPAEERKEYADIVLVESERLSNLSTEILKLSQLEDDSYKLKKEPFHLSEQIRNVLLLLQKQWEEKGLNLDLQMEEIDYVGDPILLQQVWVNLISNAIKFSPNDTTITISVKKQDRVIVSIQDEGAGMSHEETEKIFNRFYKSDSSRNSKGTGLGLPIAKKIVTLHSGRIYVTSKLNEGSTFIVELW